MSFDVSLIVAMAPNRVIGDKGKLPWYLPNDLKHFKNTTMGKPVIMGRKTFDAIGRALPGRHNLVLTRDPSYQNAAVSVVHSPMQALITVSADYPKEVMVIGGGEVYLRMYPMATRMYVTEVMVENMQGDAYFLLGVPFDDWVLVKETAFKADSQNPYDHVIREYRRC